MLLLIYITWIVAGLYLLLLIFYSIGWNKKAKSVVLPSSETNFLSVIIPARNEEANIAKCLESVLSQNFPSSHFEIIVIDDNSDDCTEQIVRKFEHIKLLSLFENTDNQIQSKKKLALSLGIAHAKGNIIVSTDADCVVPPGWLSLIDHAFGQPGLMALAGPVKLDTADGKLFSIFQSLDFAMYQGITAAGINTGVHHLANGANLSYRKSAFEAVNGFSGHEHLPTGDDMLLVQKIRTRFPGSVQYLKNPKAVVSTFPCPDLKSFLHQRIRWASKSAEYSEKSILPIMMMVFLLNLSLLVLVIASLIYRQEKFLDLYLYQHLGLIFLIKICAELFLLIPVLRFFKKSGLLLWFIFLQPFHVCYTVSAAFTSFMGSYEWKGRQIRKADVKK